MTEAIYLYLCGVCVCVKRKRQRTREIPENFISAPLGLAGVFFFFLDIFTKAASIRHVSKSSAWFEIY